MTEPMGVTYRETLRRAEMAVPALVGHLVALLVSNLLSKLSVKGHDLVMAILPLLGGCVGTHRERPHYGAAQLTP